MNDRISTRSPTPVDKHVGIKVRIQRLSLGLSQTQLGDSLGLSFQQIQKYENGTSRISASRLQQIASVLNVEPSFFFERAAEPTSEAHDPLVYANVVQLLASKEGVALIKAYAAITDAKRRRQVVKFAQNIARA